ncbi:glycerate kinase [Paenibacillus radicis (ex Gao et al. 2016)]|uniref:Glycerate kinase n=1 Tax=Paenibacillus radicis (ex Gao et al. 2016) TaxID=1737354 RepID=A0A917HQR9_9BACL|nr:glycerate kinase [Paenibacillus radicis (ex Gao et al. 2016)]GGG87657.1 glycerate kinase [Paenibacillus radicis (ex Gao et al. 2016)]
MKIIVAPDSFKGSLSAVEAAAAIARGVRRALPHADVVEAPVADGGEGTLSCLLAATGGERVEAQVLGPMGKPVRAAYGRLGDAGRQTEDWPEPETALTRHNAKVGDTAVIEMAEASGLTLVQLDERNPLLASTYGTGQLLQRALDDGCRRFILALGGSATNDGGAGMLQALGMKLLDREGKPLAPGIGGGRLIDIAAIDDSEWDSRIAESTFIIATDVGSPFVGPSGASQVFGPQKGADPAMVRQLEEGMTAWADRIAGKTGVSLHELPGAGAAGGLGGAFLAFFPAAARRGIDVVMDYAGLRRRLDGAALVLVGEGRIDGQTAAGKAPMGVAHEARRLGIPAIALAGSVGAGIEPLYDAGIVSAHSIINGPMTLEEAMSRTAELLEQTAEQVVRTFAANLPS